MLDLHFLQKNFVHVLFVILRSICGNEACYTRIPETEIIAVNKANKFDIEMKMYLRHMKIQELPEAGIGGIKLLGGIGGLIRIGLLSFASTITTSEVRKDFATTAACSMQHLTTW